jgi:hypothetical protein
MYAMAASRPAIGPNVNNALIELPPNYLILTVKLRYPNGQTLP